MTSSRRSFLATGLALPAAGLAIPRPGRTPAVPSAAPAAPDKLAFRTLGKTGLKVTSLGFGCMITSDASVIVRAADAGINYFDTARGYQSGNNERMVGAALKSKRQQVHISTKTGAKDKAEALAQLDTSLKELGTDYVDIWHLHGKQTAAQLTDDLLEAQQIAKKAGKIRFAGVSLHSGHAEVIPAAIQSGKIDVILMAYNFTMGSRLDEWIVKAKAAGLGVVAMKVMAGGYRHLRDDSPSGAILKRPGAMSAALRWVLKNPDIGTTIPSMTDMDQFEDNFKCMPAKFSAEDEKTLAAHLERIGPLYCRMCSLCAGTCRRGLPVSDLLRFVTYADGYGQFALGRERFRELPGDVTAVRCGDCAHCTVQCPHGVHVAERISRAQELFG
ncbi:MAG: aldo/keto reductase [Bryobacteraceae bacterium]|jgi:predicted aldo/keto reductase-like oxidoreductase